MKISSNKKFLVLLLLSLFITFVISDCPKSNFNSKDCINKGGKVKVTIKNECQTEICVITKKITKKTTKKTKIRVTSKKTKNDCPIFTVDNYGCTQRGGRITSYTSEGCATPTCVVEAITTTTKPCPIFTVDNYGCTQKGGRITSYTSDGCATPTCVIEAITTTTKPCPIFTVDNYGCTQKGGSITSYTSDGCATPTCVVEEITPTKEPCPEYEPIGPYCTEMGGTPTAYIDEDGCLNPYCKTESDTPTTTTKLCPMFTFDNNGCTQKGGTVTSYTSDGCVTPTCVVEATTTTKPCPIFSVDNYGCTQKGGTITSYTSDGCATPTCIVESAAVATKPCPIFSVDNYGCTQKGGTITSYTSDGCVTPTCVVDEKITPRVPCPLYKPIGPYCREKGGIPSSYTDENGCYHPICITESITPTTTTKQCPTFSVDTYGCTQKGGTITSYTSDGCATPTCVVDEIIPTKIPCPLYAPIGPYCMEMGGRPSVVIDENGCPHPTCVTESITPTTTTKQCPTFSVDTYGCSQKGGTITSYTSEGCSYPTCVVDEIIPTKIPCPLYVPIGPYCTEMGGRPSAVIDENGCSHPTCVTEFITPTTTTKQCPTFSVDTYGCSQKGGTITSYTSEGCSYPTCVVDEIIPTIIPCPIYVPIGPYCTEMGGIRSSYKDSRGCVHPTCILDEITATPAPTYDEITNSLDEIDTTTEFNEPSTTSTSEEIIPPVMRCPRYMPVGPYCTRMGGRPSAYKDSRGCSHPTCIMDGVTATPTPTFDENTELDEIDANTELDEPTSILEDIPVRMRCPEYFFNRRDCIERGGRPSSFINGMGCPHPTCIMDEITVTDTTVYEENTSTLDETTTSTTTIISLDETTTTTTTLDITSFPQNPCPTYRINEDYCIEQGGIISSITDGNGCPVPICIKKTPLPPPPHTIGSPTRIPITTTKECPMFKVDVNGCNQKGGTISSYIKDGCSFPTCVVEEPLPTPTITLPPIFTSKLCPMFKIDFEGCIRKGGIMSSVMRDGCSYPTCVIEEATPTANAATLITPPPPNPCPQVTFNKLSCTKKGGRVKYVNENGCEIPVCENVPFEMGAF